MGKNSKVVQLKHTTREFIFEEEREISIPVRIMRYNVLERCAGDDGYRFVGEEFHGYLEGPDNVSFMISCTIEPEEWKEELLVPLREAGIAAVLEGLRVEIVGAFHDHILATNNGGQDDLE